MTGNDRFDRGKKPESFLFYDVTIARRDSAYPDSDLHFSLRFLSPVASNPSHSVATNDNN